MTLLAVAIVLLAQQPAAAPGEDAETAIERGRLLIRDLYEEQALEVLKPYLGDEGLQDSLRSRAFVYAGIAQLNLGDETEGRRMFGRALEIDIGAVLPEWVSRRVRDAYQLELERVMRAKSPAPPEVTTRAMRHAWAGPTLLAGAAISAAMSVFGFVRWSDFYAQYRQAPVGLDAQAAYRAGVPYYLFGDAAAAVAGVLLVVALAWWFLPG
ncbi:MAG: hypothetical protein IPJ65_24865 [Archangiaceae bacterium]|nr:hypothetical protein [Archangiaceae bacterium]